MFTGDSRALAGRTALVTGASRGIGRALAAGLARAGVSVGLHFVGQEELALEAQREAASFGVKAATLQANLEEETAPSQLAQSMRAALGAPDILVLNAAVRQRFNWYEIPRSEALRQYCVNFLANLELIREFTPEMQERGWGRIVAIGSVQQVKHHPDFPVYGALKAGLAHLLATVAKDLAPQGITVNTLAPGATETHANAQVLSDAAFRDRVLTQIPARTIGQPEDMVGALLLLVSDAGRYITGATLYVDGGMHIS